MRNRTLISVAVASCFAAGMASANPTGPSVVSGAATFQQPNASTLNVTNSPGAIINWQGFSIGAGEVTRFIQQSAASSVLNRVTGGNVSQIYGQLLSNGQVYLVNPGGIVVGPGAIVDTAGFIASTLNMVDADYLAGKLRFSGDGQSGAIVNQGWIRTGYGGKVVLVAPQIENSGLIHTPGGELILAAGQKLTISSLDHEGVQFELQAPADSVVNLGRLLADGGAVGVFTGTLRHSGDIRANSLVYDQAGQVVLRAANDLQLSAGSTTTADGKAGGGVTVQSTGGLAEVAGTVSAHGSAGRGGDIRILGGAVALRDSAAINASGSTGGGQILVGGDYQGGNAAVQNSSNTFVGSGARLRADAHGAGDGGRVIVWSDGKAQFYGSLSAKGGPDGGDGGFAEVSGKQNLVFAGSADLGAPKGKLGSLLLDPLDLFVDAAGGLIPDIIDENTDFPANAATVSPETLANIVGNVTLYASRYMRINSAIDLTTTVGATPAATPGKTLTATVGTWPDTVTPLADTDPLNLSVGTVPNRLDIGAGITTANGAISLTAPAIQSFAAATLATAGGAVSLSAAGAIQAASLAIDAGSGAVTATAGTGAGGGFLQLGAVSGGSLSASAPDSVQLFGDTLVNGGAVTLSSANSSVSTFSTIDTRAGGTGPAGGAVSITAPLAVTTRSILAGSGNITLSGSTLDNSSGAPLDTTGAVALTASAGSISGFKINNAASITASATNADGSASVNLSSDTVLNANNVSATTTQCNSFSGGCSSASVVLSGEQGVNLGTVTATAPTNFVNRANFGDAYADERFESINSFVNVFSNAGPILAQSATSLVTANNVALGTAAFDGTTGGGGIGTAATPVRVDARSSLNFSPNGAFNTQIVGTTGPNALAMQIGVAPTGQSYTGTLTKTGQIGLSVSANDTTVTASTLNISSGFDTRISNTSPSVRLYVPNGALVATSVSVPKGDQTGILSPAARRNCDVFGGLSCPPQPTIEGLPVQLWADKDVTVTAYTRETGTVAKSTDIRSFNGSVTLGPLNAGIDSLSVFGSTGVSIPSLTHADGLSVSSSSGPVSLGTVSVTGSLSAFSSAGDVTFTNVSATAGATASTSTGNVTLTGLTSSGAVTASSSTGNISLGSVVSGPGGATFTAPLGAVQALTDSSALEATSGGTIAVNATTIGAGGSNPLDLAGASVVLTSSNGGTIGLAAAPVTSNTQNLTVNAANGSTFNVTTGATALKNLAVTASATAVGAGGTARVTSEATNYDFTSDGTNFTFNPVVPGTQFTSDGLLSFTATTGNVALGNANLGTGGLAVTATNGSIAAGTLDGAAITLTAGTVAGAAPVSITTGTIGATTRPASLTLTAGNGSFEGAIQRAGSVETTGGIAADTVTITTYDGNIKIGANGTDPIGSSGTPAGAVSLNAQDNFGLAGSAGTIQVGNVFGTDLSFYNRDNTISTGNLDATQSIRLQSDGSTQITTGALDAPSLTVGPTFCCPYPGLTTGAIGATRPVKTLSIASTTTNIGGAISGDPASASSINISAFGPLTIGGAVTAPFAASTVSLNAYGGLLTVGDVTAGDGSSVNLNSSGATAFEFQSVNAGATGSVSISSSAGITQTGGAGITAEAVNLSATSGTAAIEKTGVAPAPVDLHGTKSLTIQSGDDARVNLNGSTLTDLTVYKYSGPDTGVLVVTGMTGQTLSVGDSGSGSHTLELASATALDFTAAFYGGGVQLTGAGIATGGGSLYMDVGGPLSATTGGITTLGGSVTLYADGQLNSGVINSAAAGNAAGGGLSLNTFNAAGHIVVDGNLNTGTGGGAISLNAFSGGSISRSGGSTLTSDSQVSLYAANGDIGSSATRMLIASPSVQLQADGVAAGNAYATLTNTSSLDIDVYNGFNVSSSAALTNLAVFTQGAGTGVPGTNLDLSAPGQTYAFARPATDLFGGALTNAFQVAAASGPTSANFRTTSGILYLGGGSIAVPNLTLQSVGGGSDIVLQGTSANPLSLSSTSQFISSARDLLITGNVSLVASGNQQIQPLTNLTAQARDGSITISGAQQSISSTNGTLAFIGGLAADEKVTVTASDTQTLSTTQFSGGLDIKLQAGMGDRASVTVAYTGSDTQTLQANRDVLLYGGDLGSTDSVASITTATGSQLVRAERNIDLIAGAGTNAAVRIASTGTGNQQVGEARRNCCTFDLPYQTDAITLQGGGAGSVAEIVAAGAQQIYTRNGTLSVLGGSGANAFARIESSATSEQLIGFPTFRDFFGYAHDTISIGAGAGTGSYARITAAGPQRVTANSALSLTGNGTDAPASLLAPSQEIRYGSITVQAGTGNNANALIQATGTQYFDVSGLSVQGGGGAGATATAQVLAGDTQFFDYAGTVMLQGGAGANSIAKVSAPQDQTMNFGSLSLTGGAGAGSTATLYSDESQFFSGGSVTLSGGLGTDALARIHTPKDQTLFFGSLNMNAGQTSGAYVKIDSGLKQYLSGGNVTLAAGGTGETTVANAKAIIEGQEQEIYASSILLKGGSGTSGNTSDALLRNLAGGTTGNHIVSANGTLTLQGGHQHSTTGVINQGAGTQSVTGQSGITLVSDTVTSPAHADSLVVIQNAGPTAQTLSAQFGGISLDNKGDGILEVTSGGSQAVQSRYVEVLTSTGATGNASLFATGNQWIHTTDQSADGYSVLVAARGTGTAKIESGASQLLEVGYPQVMTGSASSGVLKVGYADTAGTSRVKAVDQNIFAGSITVESGSGNGSIAELKASNDQVISTVLGGIQVLGGAGNDTLAQIDPVTQTILVNGGIDVIGGTGTNAVAQILNGSGAQTLLATNGDIVLTGGTGAGANALITSGGLQTVGTSGSIVLTNGINPLGGAGGTANISPLGNPPASCASPCILTTVASSGTLVAETLASNTVTDEFDELIELTGTTLMAEDTTILTRRAPICR